MPTTEWMEKPCAQKGQRGRTKMTHSSRKPLPHTLTKTSWTGSCRSLNNSEALILSMGLPTLLPHPTQVPWLLLSFKTPSTPLPPFLRHPHMKKPEPWLNPAGCCWYSFRKGTLWSQVKNICGQITVIRSLIPSGHSLLPPQPPCFLHEYF